MKLLIDSRQKVSGTTSDFVVQLSTPLYNVIRTELRQMVISDGIYNILTGYNTISLKFEAIGEIPPSYTGDISIAAGFYTTAQLAAALQVSIRAQVAIWVDGLGYTGTLVSCSINDDNKLVLKTASQNFNIGITFPDLTTARQFGAVSVSLLIGTIGSTFSSLTMAKALSEEDVEYLAIQSDELGYNVITTSGLQAYDIVPVTDRSKAVSYERVSSVTDNYLPKTLSRIRIRLVKPSGLVPNLRGSQVYLLLDVFTK